MVNSRRKGKVGELEAAAYLADAFNLPCRRGQQYSGLEAADVVGVPGIHFEIKRCERLNIYGAISQARNDSKPHEVPVVMHRKNRRRWLVILEAGDLIRLTEAIIKFGCEVNNE